VFVADTATVVGDVELGDGASVWYGAVLRADGDVIRIGARTNIQDLTTIHIGVGAFQTIIGADVTVGHRAVLHGCTIEDETMIGIGSIILDGAVVERGAIVAAGAVVSPGKRVPAREMWGGIPAAKIRAVRPEEIETIRRNAEYYRLLGEQHATGAPVAKLG
jgi:carbonic anhydrase/acetyltransferase-like protein (isoleucine patch superfamily)